MIMKQPLLRLMHLSLPKKHLKRQNVAMELTPEKNQGPASTMTSSSEIAHPVASFVRALCSCCASEWQDADNKPHKRRQADGMAKAMRGTRPPMDTNRHVDKCLDCRTLYVGCGRIHVYVQTLLLMRHACKTPEQAVRFSATTISRSVESGTCIESRFRWRRQAFELAFRWMLALRFVPCADANGQAWVQVEPFWDPPGCERCCKR